MYRRYPRYPDDADYQTNSPSYYDDLSRKQKLIELLSKKIWEYDEELAKRFEAWDKNLEEFDEEVLKLLVKWLNDGTLEQIINHDVLGNKADKEYVDEEFEKTNKQLTQIATELEGLEVNVTTVGVYPNDGIDHTQKLKDLISSGVIPVFPSGRYIVNGELPFKHGQGIRLVGDVEFYSTNFVGVSGSSIIRVDNKGDDFESLPSITHNLIDGNNRLTFNEPHNLNVDDILCLYNDVRFSWSSDRDYYKQGEFVKVQTVIDTHTITLDNGLLDNYITQGNSYFGVYKMNMGTFNITGGKLKVIQNRGGDFRAITFERVKDLNVNNIEGYSLNGSNIGIELTQCYNFYFNGKGIQKGSFTGASEQYGIMVSNCQHGIIDGYFVGTRHGMAHGGSDGVGSVVTRDIKSRGTVKNDFESSTFAFDTHGNCEDISFEGTVYGGLNLAGKRININGIVYSGKRGVCVYGNGMKSFDFDLSGAKFISKGDNPRNEGLGIVDFGFATIETDDMEGGTLDLSNISVIGEKAGYGVVVRTGKLNMKQVEINVNLSNANISIEKGGTQTSNGLFINKKIENALGFNEINLLGTKISSDSNSIRDYNELFLNEKKGEIEFTYDTSSNYMYLEIDYDKPFISGYFPTVVVNLNRFLMGSSQINVRTLNSNATGFRVVVHTTDTQNFSSDLTDKLFWTAS